MHLLGSSESAWLHSRQRPPCKTALIKLPPDPYADQYNHQTLKHHRAPSRGALGNRTWVWRWRSGVASLWIHLAIWHVQRGEKLTSAAVTVLALVIKLDNYVRAGKLEADRCACASAGEMRQTLQIFCWLRDSVCRAKAPIEELRILSYWCLCKSHNQHQRLSSFVSYFSCLLF